MDEKVITQNSKKTQKIALYFARELIKKGPQKKATVLALVGQLGSGKTTFLQGFAKGLGIKEKILSPTFIIKKRFDISKKLTRRAQEKKFFKNFFHIDCYRLKDKKDILSLGIKEILSDSQNIIAIEWPEKIKKILPPSTYFIYFKLLDGNKREIIFKSKSKNE